MVFDSPLFIFSFLPAVLFGYLLAPKFLKNIFLLSVSIFFYAWGDMQNMVILLCIVAFNYMAGVGMVKYTSLSRIIMILALLINVGLLIYYKYFVFILSFFRISSENIPPVIPLGISFIVFRVMSYLVDVYNGKIQEENNLVHFSLYIMLFPIIIAGPIVRYADVAKQLSDRQVTLPLFFIGIKRFIIGLGKKMIIANSMATVVNAVFQLQPIELTFSLAWLAVISYTFQIYFDFSGYSDMAIGLGNMFGFQFKENFNYPYVGKSIKEFWQRWHITLSSWFRDYVYIPLGGNRYGTFRTYFHIVITFLLTGLWHGASLNFIVWGLYYGIFLVIEKAFDSSFQKLWNPLRHIYVLSIVIIGWVFFRAETLSQAFLFLKTMFGIGSGKSTSSIRVFLTNEYSIIFFISLLTVVPIVPLLSRKIKSYMAHKPLLSLLIQGSVSTVVLVGILLYSLMQLAGTTHSSFIYFKF